MPLVTMLGARKRLLHALLKVSCITLIFAHKFGGGTLKSVGSLKYRKSEKFGYFGVQPTGPKEENPVVTWLLPVVIAHRTAIPCGFVPVSSEVLVSQ